jgi:hypothetical protein
MIMTSYYGNPVYFNCVVLRDKQVRWSHGIRPHNKSLKGIPDDTLDPDKYKFCKITITHSGSIFDPGPGRFTIAQDVTPRWWTLGHKQAAEAAHGEWLADLGVIRKDIVDPFKISPPGEITPDHLRLLKRWEAAYISSGFSPDFILRKTIDHTISGYVEAKVWHDVGQQVEFKIIHSGGKAQFERRSSALAAIWAYIGSFFNIPRDQWKGTQGIMATGYPYQSLVDLWDQGLVPSCTGGGTVPYIWRLHGGPRAGVLWEGALVNAL